MNTYFENFTRVFSDFVAFQNKKQNDIYTNESLYEFKFSKQYWKPLICGVKITTIRDKSKPVKTKDQVRLKFMDTNYKGIAKISKHYAIQFRDIGYTEAKNEGYCHPELLKHELKQIYPTLKETDYVYIYEFEDVEIKEI